MTGCAVVQIKGEEGLEIYSVPRVSKRLSNIPPDGYQGKGSDLELVLK